ncbi:VanZ family protein [Deinococcus sp. 6YEL10]|uniref:VanZ family protein n=1 Tax=Deinococcus sp. 6YEL10 TaxID=2745870 RepID=UPI001E4578F3|nr:VanZ family protein [Deinococcus sp. 6YEL10]MCD0161811.1 VanZ family protein [Deinococcus sp. 6YEL10]
MRRPRPLWWVPALLIMGAIWSLSSAPLTPGPSLEHPKDWIAHFLAYFALAFTLARATGRRGAALVIAAWFGALDEVHQAFVPPREAGVQDWLFDVAGAWLGSWLALRRAARTSARPDGSPERAVSHAT